MYDGACDRQSSQSGFTVLEALVALALFSLLATFLFGNIHFGLKAWHRGTAHAEAIDHDMAIRNFLRQIIGNAYPYFVSTDAVHSRIAFDGGSDSLSFLADAPKAMGNGGRFRFALSVNRSTKEAKLILAAQPELGNPQHRELVTERALLTGIDQVDFAYFGLSSSDQTGQWHATWRQQSELPRLVRIRINFRTEKSRPWPDLVIVTHLTTDVGCVFDPLTMRCRGR